MKLTKMTWPLVSHVLHFVLFVIEKVNWYNLMVFAHCCVCSELGKSHCSQGSLSRFTSNFGIKKERWI